VDRLKEVKEENPALPLELSSPARRQSVALCREIELGRVPMATGPTRLMHAIATAGPKSRNRLRFFDSNDGRLRLSLAYEPSPRTNSWAQPYRFQRPDTPMLHALFIDGYRAIRPINAQADFYAVGLFLCRSAPFG